jgi:hypothetical protein
LCGREPDRLLEEYGWMYGTSFCYRGALLVLRYFEDPNAEE